MGGATDSDDSQLAFFAKIDGRIATSFRRIIELSTVDAGAACVSGRMFVELILGYIDNLLDHNTVLTKESLYRRINRLHSDGAFPRLPTRWAHSLRELGNTGSHAGEVGQDADFNDAQEVLDVARKLGSWFRIRFDDGIYNNTNPLPPRICQLLIARQGSHDLSLALQEGPEGELGLLLFRLEPGEEEQTCILRIARILGIESASIINFGEEITSVSVMGSNERSYIIFLRYFVMLGRRLIDFPSDMSVKWYPLYTVPQVGVDDIHFDAINAGISHILKVGKH